LSAATGVLSAFLISFPDYLHGVIAAVLFQGAAILDCCDGDVARRTGTQTDWGGMLNLVSDYICYATMFAAIGWRVSQSAGDRYGSYCGILAAVASGTHNAEHAPPKADQDAFRRPLEDR
jgi:phosphatidylglycerophosphate synthase